MSILISCQALGKAFATGPLFQNISFGVYEGDRIGLIGPNGTGKSTLMSILAGVETAEEGTVTRRTHLRVAHVPQHPTASKGSTARSFLQAELAREALGETEAAVEADKALSFAGFSDPDTPTATLSGGWMKRLFVAAAWARSPDLMFLDEPTNHLDIETVLWLEDKLKSAPFAWFLISHDRMFLERTVTKLMELNPVFPDGLFEAEGRYSDFLEKRDEFLQAEKRREASLANKVRNEVAWLRRGPKARGTKAKSRKDRAEQLQTELADVRGRLETSGTDVDFSASGRKAKKLIELSGVAISRGERTLVDGLDLTLTPGRKLGLVGANGTGKSTFLHALSGTIAPDLGSIETATNLELVHFEQHRESLEPELTLKETLADDSDTVIFRGEEVHVTTWAKRFSFSPEQLHVRTGDLSGGEKARAVMARMMLRPADVLLLDEPTNDLDIPTLEVLEEALVSFPGALVLVSHDRYFLERICNEFLGLDGSGAATIYADYDQWEVDLKKRGRTKPGSRSAASSKGGAAETSRRQNRTKKLSYKEQREYDGMEQRIMEAEAELDRCQQRVDDPSLAHDPEGLQKAAADLEKARKDVEALYERWADLEAKQSSN